MDMFLVRNPWKKTSYNLDWGASDKRWNAQTKKQVPYGVDPTQGATNGYFVMPKEYIIAGKCFRQMSIAHIKHQDGYKTMWYDEENATEGVMRKYKIKPTNNNKDIFIGLETYFPKSVPQQCIQGRVTYKDINGLNRGSTVTA